jgi:hypothetical protein
MMPTLVDEPPEVEGWIHEIKEPPRKAPVGPAQGQEGQQHQNTRTSPAEKRSSGLRHPGFDTFLGLVEEEHAIPWRKLDTTCPLAVSTPTSRKSSFGGPTFYRERDYAAPSYWHAQEAVRPR